jgi:GMC oxidoreductase
LLDDPIICLLMYCNPHATAAAQEHDVCIVGAGPVGLALALECEAKGLSVLLLEAGQARAGQVVDQLCNAEISDPLRHAPLDHINRCGLGGTSELWGGRCVPLDDIDYERRSFVNQSGWPISATELENYNATAASYLDCGNSGFISEIAGWDQAPEMSCQSIERLSSQPRLGRRFRSTLGNSNLIRVHLGEVVEGVALDGEQERVTTLRLASGLRPSARLFVLACGGLQITRLLLGLQRIRPQSFGGEDGPLGRFYMGHLTGRIASMVLHEPDAVEDFYYRRDHEGYWYRRRFTLGAATQREQELLNTVFWLGNPPFYDPSHGSAAASSLYLSLGLIPRLKYFSKDFISFHHGGGISDIKTHLANIWNGPGDAARALARAVHHQLSSDKLKPFFITNPRGVYSLHYHSEQLPQASNRVRLKRNSDQLTIDYNFCDQDTSSVVRAHDILDRALRRSGKGYLKYWQYPEERAAHVLAQASDGYHQIGTARMGDGEHNSVVDKDCRVHGLKNLFIAGSAVFPTSGQANPTFSAVALAVRLAAHLSKELRCLAADPSIVPSATRVRAAPGG